MPEGVNRVEEGQAAGEEEVLRCEARPLGDGRCAPNQHEALISRSAGKANGNQTFSRPVPMVFKRLWIARPRVELSRQDNLFYGAAHVVAFAN